MPPIIRRTWSGSPGGTRAGCSIWQAAAMSGSTRGFGAAGVARMARANQLLDHRRPSASRRVYATSTTRAPVAVARRAVHGGERGDRGVYPVPGAARPVLLDAVGARARRGRGPHRSAPPEVAGRRKCTACLDYEGLRARAAEHEGAGAYGVGGNQRQEDQRRSSAPPQPRVAVGEPSVGHDGGKRQGAA